MIYINGRFLTQKMTGVHRFAYNLSKALVKAGVECRVIMPSMPIVSSYDISGFDIVKYGSFTGHFWEQVILPIYMRKHKKDLLLNFTSLGPIAVSNKIITIHDLAFIENPSWYSKSYVLLYKLLTPLSAKTSKHIITVSDFSKREIIKKLKVKESKISVIYNAADVCLREDETILKKIPPKYVLAVSSIDPRKNFERLIKACTLIPDYKLVVAGEANPVFKQVNISETHNNVFFVGRVTDAELTTLYKNATAFIYPSLYEGFGIPPIEAMAYGCPVVVSDIEVLHEVCRDAALYVDPYDVNQIAHTISQIIDGAGLQEELKVKGYNNIKRFNWQNSSIALINILEKYLVLKDS